LSQVISGPSLNAEHIAGLSRVPADAAPRVAAQAAEAVARLTAGKKRWMGRCAELPEVAAIESHVPRGKQCRGGIEAVHSFLAALRPAPVFDTERRHRRLAGLRRDNYIVGDNAILPAALDDVAELDLDFLVTASILDGKLVDLARLVNDDFSLFERFFQSDYWLASQAIPAVDQEDC
jgi:hypothetical protein